MTNIAMMMNASRYLRDENPEKLVEYCQKTKELASSTLQETRQILYKLRAVSGQATQSAPVFFARLCRDFSEATGVTTDCHVGNLPPSVNERVFGTLFRAVQVGFINALRHGSAGHIVLAFWVTEAELIMRIWNDTPLKALDPAAGEGIGLRGIRERLEVLNGRLSYGPVTDGYQVMIRIPREETGIAAD
jgi:signal transduction histidine kinase